MQFLKSFVVMFVLAVSSNVALAEEQPASLPSTQSTVSTAAMSVGQLSESQNSAQNLVNQLNQNATVSGAISVTSPNNVIHFDSFTIGQDQTFAVGQGQTLTIGPNTTASSIVSVSTAGSFANSALTVINGTAQSDSAAITITTNTINLILQNSFFQPNNSGIIPLTIINGTNSGAISLSGSSVSSNILGPVGNSITVTSTIIPVPQVIDATANGIESRIQAISNAARARFSCDERTAESKELAENRKTSKKRKK